MTQSAPMTRRQTMTAAAAAALVPSLARANSFREITWDDLIPAGTPYGEIIGPGIIDEANDVWNPQYDANGQRVNTQLDGQNVKLPGYIIPFDLTAEGVTSFMLVPYVGACIHVPPPPPNQLVFVHTARPWPSGSLWEPVWVLGRLSVSAMTTQIADVGYQMQAEAIEAYDW